MRISDLAYSPLKKGARGLFLRGEIKMTQTIEEIAKKENLTVELLRIFPLQGEWTEAEYFRLPETNRIIELSEGRLIITPAPTDQHQKISFRLSLLIGSYVLSNNLGEVRYSPLDVRLWEGKVRQPDIAFMSNEHLDRITEKMWGVPDLAVEILSEGTAKTDKGKKFREYQKAGVLEYWIVDPFKQAIEVYALEDGIYKKLGEWGMGEIAKSKLLDGFEVNIDEVMV
jgi:Uma2 family endonuclease